MKNWTIIFLLLITACKCNNGKDKQTAEDTILVIPDTLLVYDVNAEAKTMKKYTEVPDSAFTTTRVINGLNEKYPSVQLQFIRQSNDTVYVSIPNADYLSQQMGSAGSAAWYADAVINLTAVPGVKYVNIDLKEGSHAAPGVFGEANYKEYRVDTQTH
jgi:hypothetical protein